MSTVTGPYTIAAGGQVSMPQPQAGGQLSQLILDNLSTYILIVNIGASVYFQAPLVEQAYNIIDTTQPINVSSIVQPGDNTTSGQLAPTWHAIGEEQQGSWPIALSGPAEVAAATAAALLEGGVPNVLTETRIGDFTIPFAAPIDVHQYGSLTLLIGGIGAGRSVSYQFYADAAGTQPVGTGDTVNADLIPVQGAYFSITGSTGVVPDVTIYGSNRELPFGHPVVAGFSSEPWILSFSGTTAAGAKVLLTTGGGQPFQGPAFAFLAISSAIKGYWFARTPLNDALLVDTGQCHAAANGSTVAIGLPIALPANTQSLGFLAETSSAGVAISADLIPNY